MIENSTYHQPRSIITQQFTDSENKLLMELMESKKSQTWSSISNILYSKCGRHRHSQAIRIQWGKLTRVKKPKKSHIIQFIINLTTGDWFCFSKASQNAKQGSLFQNFYYGRQFIKVTFIESMQFIQSEAAKAVTQIDATPQTILDYQLIQQVAELLLRGKETLCHSIKPQKMRFILIYMYVKKLMRQNISQQQIVASHQFMMNYIQEFQCDKKISKANNGRVSYVWEMQQLRKIYEIYCEHGFEAKMIQNTLLKNFGDKSKFNSNEIKSIMARLLMSGFKKLTETLVKSDTAYRKQKNYQHYLDNRHAQTFLLRKDHQQFYLTVQLMSLGFGKSYDLPELEKIYRLVIRSYQKIQTTQIKRRKVVLDI